MLDLDLTYIRIYIFDQQTLVSFDEIQVNHQALDKTSEVIEVIGDNVDRLFNKAKRLNFVQQTNNFAMEVKSIIKIDNFNNSIPARQTISIDKHAITYIMGENSRLPGIDQYLKKLLECNITYATDLIALHNQEIPPYDLSRLFVALSLATWGR